MGNKKEQISSYLPSKTLEKISALQKIDSCKGKSRNQIIEEAIDFYYGYQTSSLSQDYLCSVYGQKVEGLINQSSDRMGRLLFKLAVEINCLTRVQASLQSIDRSSYDKLRKAAVEDAKATKGIISIYEA